MLRTEFREPKNMPVSLVAAMKNSAEECLLNIEKLGRQTRNHQRLKSLGSKCVCARRINDAPFNIIWVAATIYTVQTCGSIQPACN